jgi:hypothetical protein
LSALLIRHRHQQKQIRRPTKLAPSNELTARVPGGSVGSTKLPTRPDTLGAAAAYIRCREFEVSDSKIGVDRIVRPA